MKRKKPATVTLDTTFSVTERDGTWLANDEEPGWHNAWIHLGNDLYLEIAVRPENYPGLTVQIVQKTQAELAEHINKEFNSGLWTARKCNIEGVILDERGEHVQGIEE